MPWTFPKMNSKKLAQLPSSMIRSIHVTSGLFDNGFTGADENQALVDNLDLSTLDTYDLFGLLGKSSVDADVEELQTPEIRIDEGDLNLEVFTDLSQYSAKTFGTSVIQDIQEIVEMAPKSTRKRAAVEVSANHDHDDYVSKKPKVQSRARTSNTTSVSSLEDATDSESTSVVGDNKYLERRRKNNIASRRSRENRKNKYVTLEIKAEELRKANEVLRAKAEKMERVTKLMKDALVKRLACAKK